MTRSRSALDTEQRARSQVGVSFRLHGRKPGVALDCVGLAAYSLLGDDGVSAIPSGYRLRGEHLGWLKSELIARKLAEMPSCEKPAAGDLLIFDVAVRQLHLGIMTSYGLVHAHAGLKKIVLAPCVSPWPVLGHWRMDGE